nr:MAG TPA: regulatory protein [Caudoviricetes sp.]
MKEIIPKDDYGVFVDGHDVALVDSRYVAQYFEKEHRSVLRDIRELDCSEEFRLHNFVQSSYKNDQGKKQPCYYMTRDGFVFLAMGYRGKKAAKFKELYIRRFNEMERFIRTLVLTRKEFPLLTENIKLLHDHPKPYHFSNECDMINRIVTGMSAKQFRQANGIEKRKEHPTIFVRCPNSDDGNLAKGGCRAAGVCARLRTAETVSGVVQDEAGGKGCRGCGVTESHEPAENRNARLQAKMERKYERCT